jgi:hypothetical protein
MSSNTALKETTLALIGKSLLIFCYIKQNMVFHCSLSLFFDVAVSVASQTQNPYGDKLFV